MPDTDPNKNTVTPDLDAIKKLVEAGQSKGGDPALAAVVQTFQAQMATLQGQLKALTDGQAAQVKELEELRQVDKWTKTLSDPKATKEARDEATKALLKRSGNVTDEQLQEIENAPDPEEEQVNPTQRMAQEALTRANAVTAQGIMDYYNGTLMASVTQNPQVQKMVAALEARFQGQKDKDEKIANFVHSLQEQTNLRVHKDLEKFRVAKQIPSRDEMKKAFDGAFDQSLKVLDPVIEAPPSVGKSPETVALETFGITAEKKVEWPDPKKVGYGTPEYDRQMEEANKTHMLQSLAEASATLAAGESKA